MQYKTKILNKIKENNIKSSLENTLLRPKKKQKIKKSNLPSDNFKIGSKDKKQTETLLKSELDNSKSNRELQKVWYYNHKKQKNKIFDFTILIKKNKYEKEK